MRIRRRWRNAGFGIGVVLATSAACGSPPPTVTPPTVTVTVTAPAAAPSPQDCVQLPPNDTVNGPTVTCTVTLVVPGRGGSDCTQLLDGPRSFYAVGWPIEQMLMARGSQEKTVRMRVSGHVGLPLPTACPHLGRAFFTESAVLVTS